MNHKKQQSMRMVWLEIGLAVLLAVVLESVEHGLPGGIPCRKKVKMSRTEAIRQTV